MGASKALLENSGDSGDGPASYDSWTDAGLCTEQHGSLSAGWWEGDPNSGLDVQEQLLVWPQQRMDPHCWRRVGRVGGTVLPASEPAVRSLSLTGSLKVPHGGLAGVQSSNTQN